MAAGAVVGSPLCSTCVTLAALYCVTLASLPPANAPAQARTIRGASAIATHCPANRQVGETGFEPATARPPAECATRLRHSPWGLASYELARVRLGFPRRGGSSTV